VAFATRPAGLSVQFCHERQVFALGVAISPALAGAAATSIMNAVQQLFSGRGSICRPNKLGVRLCEARAVRDIRIRSCFDGAAA